MEEITVYKIQNIRTGEFSKGGYRASFTKKGRSWTGIGPFKNHLNSVEYFNPEDLVVCSYQLVQTGMSPLVPWLAERQEAKQARQDVANRYMEEYRKKKELAELQRLKEKYEP